jgi:cellobiose dehydrogenase (acceptor)
MKGFTIASVFALASVNGLRAQQTGVTYTDPVTGFTFQRYVNGNYTFGIAAPENITTDFIGQFSVASKTGWAGASIGGTSKWPRWSLEAVTLTDSPMQYLVIGSLLVVAYPNGDNITHSIRQADDYVSPHLINGTDASIGTISAGTYVNDTAFTITFLCKDCILTDGRTFTLNETMPILGWAMSTDPIADPSSPESTLVFHQYYGSWGVEMDAAKSPDFDTWASMASFEDS